MLRFAVVGIDHGHTFDHVKGLLAAGGEFVGYCPQTSVPAIRENFEKTYPDVPQIDRERIFADASIDACVSDPPYALVFLWALSAIYAAGGQKADAVALAAGLSAVLVIIGAFLGLRRAPPGTWAPTPTNQNR